MVLDGFVAKMGPSSRCGRSEPPRLTLKLQSRGQYDQIPAQNLKMLLLNKSKEEYTNILSTSVIQLIHTLVTGRSVASIKGDIQVTFLGEELPIHVKLNESSTQASLYETNDYGHLKMDKESGSINSKVFDCQLDNSRIDNHFSPNLFHRDDISSVGSSPPRTVSIKSDYTVESIDSKCRDQTSLSNIESISSDGSEESRCTSNDSDYISNDQVDKTSVKDTFLRGNTLPRLKPSADLAFDNDDIESPLDIKVGCFPGRDVDDRAEAMKPEEKGTYVQDSSLTTPDKKVNLGTSLNENLENNFTTTSSDEIDSEVAMDLSGDCKIIRDSVSVSDRQGGAENSLLLAKNIKCRICLHTFSDGISLSNHAFLTHKIHLCYYCSHEFTAKKNLKRHIRIHTDLRPYNCPQCPMIFDKHDDFKDHILSHNYAKPFRCSICKKGYMGRVCLHTHMVKTHGSRLMYICPQCGESFDREDIFSKHTKDHTKFTKYVSDICPLNGSNNNLKSFKHRPVHNHKLFSCKECSAYFSYRSGYADHIRKHVKIKSTPATYVASAVWYLLHTNSWYDMSIRMLGHRCTYVISAINSLDPMFGYRNIFRITTV